MKYCSNCGKELSDDSKFCTNCGEPTGTEFDVSETKHYENRNPAREAVCSKLYLVAAFAKTIVVILSIFSVFTVSVDLESSMKELEQALGYSIDYSEYLGVLQTGANTFSVLSMLPAILFCVGLWLIYNSAKKGNDSTTGFTLSRISIILQIIGMSILTVIVLLMGIFLGVMFDEIMVGLLMFIIVGIIAGIGILFYVKELKSLKILQNDMANATLEPLSTYVIVIGFIAGVIAILSFLSDMGENTLIDNLSSFVSIIWVFAASIWMNKYKNYR
jgi:hypothetical protein